MNVFAAVLVCLAQASAAQDIAQQVEAVAAQAPELHRAHWGAKVVKLGSGEVVYSRNEDSFFVPASNTKLFSTALALTSLGSDYKLTTRVLTTLPPQNGVLTGDLILAGSGDPTLSGRPMPYQYKAPFGPSTGPLDELAGQLKAMGIQRVGGRIIGDDTAYVYEPFPEGWSADDTVYGYGAPVSALILNDNLAVVRVAASASGVNVTLDPANGYFSLDNRVEVGRDGQARVYLDRRLGSRVLSLWGTMRPNTATALEAAVDDPALFAAHSFREALIRQGIQVSGDVGVRHRHPFQGASTDTGSLIDLVQRQSPPLSQLVQVTNKVSHNLWAEILLREVARRRGSEPSRQAGIQQLQKFLGGIGAPKTEYNFEDGSGLSRLNLITPALVIRLLRSMDESAEREAWLESLPVGGEDGSLARRFETTASQQVKILAKTGTLSHVTALSGYIESSRGRLAFSIIVNNSNARTDAIRKQIDKLVTIFASGV